MKDELKEHNLTEIEYNILKFVAAGLNNKEIGDKMFVSHHTIKARLSVIMNKLKAENRSNAVYIATKLQIIE